MPNTKESKRHDVKIKELVAWNQFETASAAEALPKIYEHAAQFSGQNRDWYWKSIASKRPWSLGVRFISLVLLVFGGVSPILAGILDQVSVRLLLTQIGVAALVVAGLLQAADRLFGWTAGWMRYISTVTTMETLTRHFELDWASYIMNNGKPLSDNDKKPLLELARKFEDEITKLQTEETEKWVAEFSSGIGILDSLIKSQRESTEKSSEAARTQVAEQKAAEEMKEKVQEKGGIETEFIYKAGVVPLKICLDGEAETTFTGPVWSTIRLSPGIHLVQITTMQDPIQTIQKTVRVLPNEIAHLEVQLP